MGNTSRYTIVVDNVSSMTRSKDIRKEMEYFGRVRDLEVDRKTRFALVEFDSSRDAEDAYNKMHHFRMDGRVWKVDWATRKDFDFMGWKWTEGGGAPSRSPSPSPSRSFY